MEETIFPTWDLTMISVDLYERYNDLRNLIKSISKVDFPEAILFPNKWEVIANITLAIRNMEEAEFRVLKAKQYIIDCSKKDL